MRNKFIACLCSGVFISLLMVSGCSPKETASVSDLPNTLTITAELPSEYPETVTKYQVDWCNVNEQAAVGAFMRQEPTQREEWAQGPILRAEGDGVEETLVLHQMVTPGGLFYHWDTAESEKILRVCGELRKMRPYEYTGDLVSQTLGTLEMEEYPPEEDLAFRPYEEAKAQLEETMDACGIPQVELYFSESHTVEVMNRNREIYNAELEESGYSNVQPIDELTESEEHYYFAYRQVHDGIPFTSAVWPRSTRSEATENLIFAIVGEDGLIEFSADGLFSLGGPLEECAILSPQEAVNVYLEEYTQAIHFENTRITGVELNYVVVKDGESYVARPAWMLTMETDKTTEGTDARPGTPYVEFQTLAVSADTGIILERETDTR